MGPMEPAAATSPAGRPDAGSSPAGDASARPPKRSVRNYLLDTSLQLRLASYLVAVATALSMALGWLLWRAYRETSRVIALGDPEVGDSIAQALASEDRWRIVAVAVGLAGVLLCLLLAAVVITHRIAGPAFVIGRTCRKVAEGDLTPPRKLRSNDLLVDLAEDVAGMIDSLRERETRERDLALRVAAKIREPSVSAADRASAADDLERMATDKGTRLGS